MTLTRRADQIEDNRLTVGILLEHAYDGWVSVEPHGPHWGPYPEPRKAYIRHTLRMLAPLMESR